MKIFKHLFPKYRIKQIGDRYYCQERILFWKDILVKKCSTDYNCERIRLHNSNYLAVFNTLDDAKTFINKYKAFYLYSFGVKGHLIKTYYETSDAIFYYSDVIEDLQLFSDNLEQLCEKILLYEDKVRESKMVKIYKLYE